MENTNELESEYLEWLHKFDVDEGDVDYKVFTKHRPFLDQLSEVSNSGVTVFDFVKKDFIYASYNFKDLLGYEVEKMGEDISNYLDSHTHPEDFKTNRKNAILIMKFYDRLEPALRADYKFVYEYRVMGSAGKYVRVIAQYQSLELDKKGNTWLALGVMDISPDQSEFQSANVQILNFKTGQIGVLDKPLAKDPMLSKRETEILNLVKEGMLSKEISDKLFISLHTVNTHRQRILEKLKASNSLEAVRYASRLGLLSG